MIEGIIVFAVIFTLGLAIVKLWDRRWKRKFGEKVLSDWAYLYYRWEIKH